MGTRGFVGFVADGREAIAYNHADSYPSYLGVNTLDWLRIVEDFDALTEAARKVRLVTSAEEPTEEDVARLAKYTNLNVDRRGGPPEWYQLLRETQGRLGVMIDVGYMEDASTFPLDSVMCEWGYLVDLDARTFEVYRGFQDEAHTDGRFARPTSEDGYYPVRLIASWSLSELPDEDAFLKAVEGDEGED